MMNLLDQPEILNDLMMVGMSQYFGAVRTFVYGQATKRNWTSQ